jgi:AcrR family transcriptional regulator
MARLTRAEQQERTRAVLLTAAEAEFGEHGYLHAKIDRIADRAELTRGAVYSNFPSKRALYLAVLADTIEQAVSDGPTSVPASVVDALEAFARVWLERLPLVDDPPADRDLRLRSLTGVVDDEPARTTLAQVGRLEALLLAIALERTPPRARRRVRLAELVLTLLHGASHMAETAPGLGDPFDLTLACRHLAGIDLRDTWEPAHLPHIPPAQSCQDPWLPPAGLTDLLTGEPVDAEADGVVVALGVHRLEAVEEAIRAVASGEPVTVAVVTSDPAERGYLVRVRVDDLLDRLHRVFPSDTWLPLRLVLDNHAVLASAAGLSHVDDATEAAVRIHEGVIVARADGRGAGHAAAPPSRRGGPEPAVGEHEPLPAAFDPH